MGKILELFSQQPPIDSTSKNECPICHLPCRQFKKLHKNPDGQPPNFACIPCRNELIKYCIQPDCPICVTPNYTISNCHYFQCDSCQELKKLSNCHSHFKDLHPKKSLPKHNPLQ